MKSLIDLPWEDILCKHVLPFINLKDVHQLQCVSRAFYDIVELYLQEYCQELDFTTYGGKKFFSSSVFRKIMKNKTNLCFLNLTNCKSWVTDNCIVPVLQSNSKITCLISPDCYNLTDLYFSCIAYELQLLQKLDLSYCRQLPNESLCLIGEKCSQLQLLNVSGCWNINDFAINCVTSNNRNLHVLQIELCYAVTSVSISKLAKNCLKLQLLNIKGCWRVKDIAIKLIGEYCKQLKELHVRDCTNITEISLARLRPRNVIIDRKSPHYLLNSDNAHKILLQI
ncbi:F-box/LRR-repeat protein 15-like [Hydractinia symbiolongicarpus]|uniref:F-box/LRR-repeat protein 15-like n=1 Tax=Hydractinia symbiolongicarpus TaxID=13093 RepID=UPI00254F4C5E|nr:F-box/LRR-repeat protein 15-like [Hydractinia symbiolongicarpus]XP_057308758.1 F-box/LRR-repeat protein 15-like [Hydractinia symbiolongicarpus]